jgi:uncharacterized protein YbdZ (MbtH family)
MEYVEQSGSEEECLADIKEVWADMKPPSLHERIGQ